MAYPDFTSSLFTSFGNFFAFNGSTAPICSTTTPLPDFQIFVDFLFTIFTCVPLYSCDIVPHQMALKLQQRILTNRSYSIRSIFFSVAIRFIYFFITISYYLLKFDREDNFFLFYSASHGIEMEWYMFWNCIIDINIGLYVNNTDTSVFLLNKHNTSDLQS